MGAKPLVSVIIPAYNAQDMIGETLDSILAQTYRNLEIIVVDDGSTDQTAQVVQGYGSRVLYYYQKNSGGCAVPRNTGIERSSGDFLCFIDADDLMAPDRVALQVAFMERYPRVGLVFSDYRNFNQDGLYSESHFQTCPRLRPQLRDRKELILENACLLLAQENFGIAGSFLLRKDMLKFESGFEPTLRACEDFHFYFRLARHTPVGVINQVGMLRRLHADSMSTNPVRMLSEGIRSRGMLRRSTEPDSVIRVHLNRYIADCHRSLARCYANSGQYVDALQSDWHALSCHFSWSGMLTACRNIARTILMAAGVHKDRKN